MEISMFQNLQKVETEWTEEDQTDYLCARMNELIMKRCDENTETGVIDVVDENTEKCKESQPEKEQEAAPKPKSKAAMPRKMKKRGQKEAEITSQTKLTKFFKSNKN